MKTAEIELWNCERAFILDVGIVLAYISNTDNTTEPSVNNLRQYWKLTPKSNAREGNYNLGFRILVPGMWSNRCGCQLGWKNNLSLPVQVYAWQQQLSPLLHDKPTYQRTRQYVWYFLFYGHKILITVSSPSVYPLGGLEVCLPLFRWQNQEDSCISSRYTYI